MQALSLSLLVMAALLSPSCAAEMIAIPGRGTIDIPHQRFVNMSMAQLADLPRNVPNYSPTSMVINGETVTLLLDVVVDVVNLHLPKLSIPSWSSSSGCTSGEGYGSITIDITKIQNPSLTITHTGFTVELDVALSLAVGGVWDKWAHEIITCLSVTCTASARSSGVLHVVMDLTLGVQQQYLTVALGNLQLSPSGWTTNVGPLGGNIVCGLFGDIAHILGIHISQLANDALLSILGSPNFTKDVQDAVSGNILAYAGKANPENQVRMCEFVPSHALSRFELVLPIESSLGFYCPEPLQLPPWGQWNCALQDVLVSQSLQSYNLTAKKRAEIELATVIGEILWPAYITAFINKSTVQVCITEQNTTLEDFLGISFTLNK